jgi:hypothetical protein
MLFSLSYKETIDVTIHNQCQDLEISPPIYFSTGAEGYIFPEQQTIIGAILKASFRIGFDQGPFKGALLCTLKKEFDPGLSFMFDNCAKSTQDTATNVQLLIAWSSEYSTLQCAIQLIEHPGVFMWSDAKLCSFYHQHPKIFSHHNSGTTTWLLNDDTIIETSFKKIQGSDYKLHITISEGTRKSEMRKPLKVQLQR